MSTRQMKRQQMHQRKQQRKKQQEQQMSEKSPSKSSMKVTESLTQLYIQPAAQSLSKPTKQVETMELHNSDDDIESNSVPKAVLQEKRGGGDGSTDITKMSKATGHSTPAPDPDIELGTMKYQDSLLVGSTDEDYLEPERPSVADATAGGCVSSSSSRRLVKLSWKRLVLLFVFLMIFPIFPIFLSAGLGGILAAVEGAPFMDGFLYVATNLLALATPLNNFNPVNIGGVIIDVYVSVIGFLIFGIVLNVINVFQIPLYLNQQIEMFVSGRVMVPVIALGVVIPIYVSLVAIVFGSLLAFLEEWPTMDGILYLFSNLLGLGTPLKELVPESLGGDIVDIIVSSIALGAAAVVVDYVTVLNPARYIRKRLRDSLDAWHVFDLSEPGVSGGHPLSYASDEDYRASVRRDYQRRVDLYKEHQERTSGKKEQPTLPSLKEEPSEHDSQEMISSQSSTGMTHNLTDATEMQEDV